MSRFRPQLAPTLFTIPVVLVCLGLLRPLKGLLIASQYKNKAAPGRLDVK